MDRSLPDLLQPTACSHADDFAWTSPAFETIIAEKTSERGQVFLLECCLVVGLFFLLKPKRDDLSMAARFWFMVARRRMRSWRRYDQALAALVSRF